MPDRTTARSQSDGGRLRSRRGRRGRAFGNTDGLAGRALYFPNGCRGCDDTGRASSRLYDQRPPHHARGRRDEAGRDRRGSGTAKGRARRAVQRSALRWRSMRTPRSCPTARDPQKGKAKHRRRGEDRRASGRRASPRPAQRARSARPRTIGQLRTKPPDRRLALSNPDQQSTSLRMGRHLQVPAEHRSRRFFERGITTSIQRHQSTPRRRPPIPHPGTDPTFRPADRDRGTGGNDSYSLDERLDGVLGRGTLSVHRPHDYHSLSVSLNGCRPATVKHKS